MCPPLQRISCEANGKVVVVYRASTGTRKGALTEAILAELRVKGKQDSSVPLKETTQFG